MNCSYINKNLLEYLDQTLTIEEATILSEHISECEYCKSSVEKEINLRKQLQNLPSTQIDPSFKHDLITGIDEIPPKRFNTGFWQGFGVATAASFLIWMFVAISNPAIEPVQNDAGIIASINAVKNIKLAFNAPADFTNVTMVIELPDFVELQGYEGQKTIRWNTHLTDGKNILNLPVIMKTAQQGQLVAKIIANNKTKIFRVPLGTVIEKSETDFKQKAVG